MPVWIWTMFAFTVALLPHSGQKAPMPLPKHGEVVRCWPDPGEIDTLACCYIHPPSLLIYVYEKNFWGNYVRVGVRLMSPEENDKCTLP